MNVHEKVQALEALLVRVQRNAAAPRPLRHVDAPMQADSRSRDTLDLEDTGAGHGLPLLAPEAAPAAAAPAPTPTRAVAAAPAARMPEPDESFASLELDVEKEARRAALPAQPRPASPAPPAVAARAPEPVRQAAPPPPARFEARPVSPPAPLVRPQPMPASPPPAAREPLPPVRPPARGPEITLRPAEPRTFEPARPTMTGPGPVRESLVGKPPATAPLPAAAKPAAAAAPRGGHGRTLMGVGIEQSAELRALIDARKEAPPGEAVMPATRRLSDELPGPATSVMGGAPPPPYTSAAAPPIEHAPQPTALRIQDLPQAVVAPPQRQELLATKPSAPPPEPSGDTISSRSRGEPAVAVEVAGATAPAPYSGESPTAPSPAIPRDPAAPYAATLALPATPAVAPGAAAPPAPAYTPPAAHPAAAARPATPHASPFTAYAPSASQPRPERSSSALRLGLLTALLVAAGVLIALRSGWLDGLLGMPTPTPTTPATGDATATAAPTAAETAAPTPTDTPTAAPSATPSATPSAVPSAAAGDPAALAFDRGYLVVNTPVEAHVYVNGRYAGPSNQPVEAPCGSRYVRIAKPDNPPGLKGPSSWLADGKPVSIGCKATTTVEMKPGPPSVGPRPTPGGATPPGGGTAAPTAQPTAAPEPAPTD